jgi:hypothetical protein
VDWVADFLRIGWQTSVEYAVFYVATKEPHPTQLARRHAEAYATQQLKEAKSLATHIAQVVSGVGEAPG